ncbi:longitudinals lacking protein, isoforms N/O/W/X/Y-like isoform X19 [Aphis craccivora]|uniref:Longitudinals lacking protein, isoforms N/O/W/X/Y-like isoform X19 n=1 Tax=Aphis craccivora TaxID=307492 RepID=A0A6G0ZB31_APHCR|nr:longitudinals lacking protein, isoforms N/O/W/X/Y-like isoform X19 [Aphis craccivora]
MAQWYKWNEEPPTPKHFQLGPFCFVCVRCDRKYKYVRNLKKHQRYQCGVPPQFQCKICSNFFTQKSSLRGHMRTVHLLDIIRRCRKPTNRCEFICGCGRIYKYRRNLTRHKRYECGVSPQFQCEVCYKQFKYKNELKAHMGFVHKFVIPRIEMGP